VTQQNTRKWETNWQRNEGERWHSKTWDTQEEAKQWAERWAKWGAWNANWRAETSSPETTCAWTCRNGRRCR
jgi:hypothetical protein